MFDYSGYGETSRHHLAALVSVGIKVNGELVRYTSEPSDYGKMTQIVKDSLAEQGSYRIKLIHTTPDEYKRLVEPGKYNIGLFYWETDRVPKAYADGLNLVDEIWTGSVDNLNAIRAGGVEKPVYIFPQPIETDRAWPEPYELPDFDGKLFYSIFEWTDRKNPETLLQAFWKEFEGRSDVGLLIKTYFRNFTLQNKKMIRDKINGLKAQSSIKEFPPTYLYLDLMDREQIMRLHKTGDIYVSAHRGEGWGVPQVEAALAGNAVISTGYGGCHDYFDNDSMRRLPYTMKHLRGMDHAGNLYTPEQRWADVDIVDLRDAMAWTINSPVESNKMAKMGTQVVKEKFGLEVVGNLMADRLITVSEGLDK
jgi:glycosyltransferase involved in cell wall biosynthesis